MPLGKTEIALRSGGFKNVVAPVVAKAVAAAPPVPETPLQQAEAAVEAAVDQLKTVEAGTPEVTS